MSRELRPPSAALRFLSRLDATLAMRSLVRIGLHDREQWQAESDSWEHKEALAIRQDDEFTCLMHGFFQLRDWLWGDSLRYGPRINAFADEAIAEFAGSLPFNATPTRRAAVWLNSRGCNGYGESVIEGSDTDDSPPRPWSDTVCQIGFDAREGILAALAEVGRTVPREVRLRPVFQRWGEQVPLTFQDITGWVNAADALPPVGGESLPATPTEGRGPSLGLSHDRIVREYLLELTRRSHFAVSMFERAAADTPGSTRVETSNGDGTKRVHVSIPLAGRAAWKALEAGLTFHARNARDIQSNEHLIADGVFPPPGWDSLRWRALAAAVGGVEADADTAEGRECIVVKAMAEVCRRRLLVAPFTTLGGNADERPDTCRKADLPASSSSAILSPIPPPRQRVPTAEEQRRELLYEQIRKLKRGGKTETQILSHLATPEGKDLMSEVRWELEKRKETRTSPRRARVPADVVAAALRSLYAKPQDG